MIQRLANKMFKDKNGEIRYEYLVGNEGALDELDKKVAEKHLVNGDYPKNSKGESYGPEQLANYVGYAPDLLYVPEEGDHPVGYYRQSHSGRDENGRTVQGRLSPYYRYSFV